MIKIWLFVVASAYIVSANEYCDIKSCGRNHTMCLYKSVLPNRNTCKNSMIKNQKFSLNFTEKIQILNLHNEYRQKVARGKETRELFDVSQPAGIIGNLTWNDELAKIALRWARQCIFDNDQCRDIKKGRVGQNIAKLGGDGPYGPSFNMLISSWYDEVEKFDSRYVKKFHMDNQTRKKVGHYTQLVWGNTKEVGCGIMRNFNKTDKLVYGTLVCNYWPAGNVDGQPIYQTL